MKPTFHSYLSTPYHYRRRPYPRQWHQISLYMLITGWSAAAHWVGCQQVVHLTHKVSTRWLKGLRDPCDTTTALGYYGTYQRHERLLSFLHRLLT